ncbi:MAG: c(7)-type cytochrome triheme domain-containing protein [Gallionella sp.]
MKKECVAKRFIAVCVGLSIAQATLGAEPTSKIKSYWLPLTQDELHDPANPSLKLLQNPAEALSVLPRDGSGDQVNWVQALRNGNIKPRLNIRSSTQAEVFDLDVLFRNTDEMNMVNFPHKQHTEWMICSTCHEVIFKSKAGATKFGMLDILNGEYCGRCHGAVAFPLTECNRCHNVPRTRAEIPDRAY